MSVDTFLSTIEAERKPGGVAADFSQVATQDRAAS